jgi:uncharacterized protein (DUF1697 family)
VKKRIAAGMAWVVLLRGVNVAGARTFLPSSFAKELDEFDTVNLGAAGTFVVRSSVTERRVRRAFTARLPFKTEILICPASEIRDLLREDPFGPLPSGTKSTLTVMAESPPKPPRLPLYAPNEAEWEAKLVSARGRYVLGLYRRRTNRIVYPNAVVERAFGVHATTRGWSTVGAIGHLLEAK